MLEFLRRLVRRPRRVGSLAELLDLAGERVEIEGRAEPAMPLLDPLTGEPCVALAYRAYPPSTTVGIDGATAHNNRAYQHTARQAVDFSFTEGPVTARVVVDPGEDVDALHRRLLAQFGVGLRAETERLAVGAPVRVTGRVQALRPDGSPHRKIPETITIAADGIWPA